MDFSNTGIRKANYDKILPSQKIKIEEEEDVRINLTELYGNGNRYLIRIRKKKNKYGHTRALIRVKDTISDRIVYNGDHPASRKEERLKEVIKQYHKKYTIIDLDEFKVEEE